ncbi:exodeoxyribonuclease VII small subunit [Emcibacter sp.]|uniref:exodeoxyribonuclease VII small subunit n=1 Tax=Emcibacter sp. TaxID=1979954 RepID=UPI002AA635B9|nr:exodeoxyribonuclease VII small subunit [Emcibacter sp.]
MEKTDKTELPEEIRAMNFEDALSALEQIVQNLESGDVSLENSIEIYTRGTQLRQHCEEKLRDAGERIEKITRQQSGALGTEPLDVE